MISYEEACYIVFDLVPDYSSYHYTVEEISKTSFDVVYVKDKDPNIPIVLAKSIIKKNPYKWKRYEVSAEVDDELNPVLSIASSIIPTSKIILNIYINIISITFC
ncbi:hypothetical protein BCV72DRAFT_218702 [Rhizopus microsporus var. microsporus]|uniref:Uncharacterized protein n=1 Tax=Rhizopus microsporus var. microsporus TaxID=86635 RepID=A0A1X0RIZ4_RHIZD|nr:hypothetical protein BCV72DRAFT_218702 [Rhizopus microsporus var. microsporus]